MWNSEVNDWTARQRGVEEYPLDIWQAVTGEQFSPPENLSSTATDAEVTTGADVPPDKTETTIDHSLANGDFTGNHAAIQYTLYRDQFKAILQRAQLPDETPSSLSVSNELIAMEMPNGSRLVWHRKDGKLEIEYANKTGFAVDGRGNLCMVRHAQGHDLFFYKGNTLERIDRYSNAGTKMQICPQADGQWTFGDGKILSKRQVLEWKRLLADYKYDFGGGQFGDIREIIDVHRDMLAHLDKMSPEDFPRRWPFVQDLVMAFGSKESRLADEKAQLQRKIAFCYGSLGDKAAMELALSAAEEVVRSAYGADSTQMAAHYNAVAQYFKCINDTEKYNLFTALSNRASMKAQLNKTEGFDKAAVIFAALPDRITIESNTKKFKIDCPDGLDKVFAALPQISYTDLQHLKGFTAIEFDDNKLLMSGESRIDLGLFGSIELKDLEAKIEISPHAPGRVTLKDIKGLTVLVGKQRVPVEELCITEGADGNINIQCNGTTHVLKGEKAATILRLIELVHGWKGNRGPAGLVEMTAIPVPLPDIVKDFLKDSHTVKKYRDMVEVTRHKPGLIDLGGGIELRLGERVCLRVNPKGPAIEFVSGVTIDLPAGDMGAQPGAKIELKSISFGAVAADGTRELKIRSQLGEITLKVNKDLTRAPAQLMPVSFHLNLQGLPPESACLILQKFTGAQLPAELSELLSGAQRITKQGDRIIVERASETSLKRGALNVEMAKTISFSINVTKQGGVKLTNIDGIKSRLSFTLPDILAKLADEVPKPEAKIREIHVSEPIYTATEEERKSFKEDPHRYVRIMTDSGIREVRFLTDSQGKPIVDNPLRFLKYDENGKPFFDHHDKFTAEFVLSVCGKDVVFKLDFYTDGKLATSDKELIKTACDIAENLPYEKLLERGLNDLTTEAEEMAKLLRRKAAQAVKQAKDEVLDVIENPYTNIKRVIKFFSR